MIKCKTITELNKAINKAFTDDILISNRIPVKILYKDRIATIRNVPFTSTERVKKFRDKNKKKIKYMKENK